MVWRVLAVAVIPVLLALGMPGCASPSLPLPPPMQPTFGQGTDANHVKLTAPCGGAENGAWISIENGNTTLPNDQRGTLTLASSCGAWDADVIAHSGDVLTITQQYGSDPPSLPEVVQVP
jgi:hypothetical protein